jgi:hypothetical protein
MRGFFSYRNENLDFVEFVNFSNARELVASQEGIFVFFILKQRK